MQIKENEKKHLVIYSEKIDIIHEKHVNRASILLICHLKWNFDKIKIQKSLSF